ncbi:MAG: ImmA/IrrE family metallo-endopeptidase [Candidatus Omnitrophica bacterium]|nr:ImmA/IrrE family metallo-endopeptidase [Candidatus Omnitrophota bacterium]MCF7897396.1 ImmA/IrrE family metallo-endopeptidase [Candidatus Omnitrophota bacterium]MCF7909497.1 ImmA/IrrE family metallo-endopeptidase [Candidatus Omnitrophota bacterium]
MAKKRIALVTPSVLKWARKYRNFSEEEVAKRLKRSKKEIIAWEGGKDSPSLAQARRISEIYKVPLAVFYLQSPPKKFSILKDYRKVPTDYPRKDTPQLSFLISELENKQAWLKEYFSFEQKKKLNFIGSAKQEDPIRSVVKSMRKNLSISVSNQIKISKKSDFLRFLIRKIEEAGISVSRQGRVGRTRIECIEIRGLAICDQLAPFIFINSNDAKSGQIFTLIHELAHLWINKSGISNISYIDRKNFNSIEIYCNKVAAEFLMDSDYFWDMYNHEKNKLPLLKLIEKISDKFKVSPEAVSLKLKNKGKISSGQYEKLRKRYKQIWEEYNKNKKKNSGFPSPNRTIAMKNSYLFTQIVITAYHQGTVSGRDASALLSAKVNNFEKMFIYSFS